MNNDYFIDCPCCGYISLKAGEHGEICPICYWEYDPFVDHRISVPSVCNHGLTLEEARANFDRIGACTEHCIKYVLPVEVRDEFEHISEKT